MYIDIHTHILPGVDDGPETHEASMKMVRRASASGVRALAATPHVLDRPDEDWERNVCSLFQTLCRSVLEERLDIDLYLGSEICFQFGMEELIARSFGTFRGMGRYCLVETPMSNYPPQFEQTVQGFAEEGVTPVVAHPERIGPLIGDRTRVALLVQAGARIQVNSGSLLGDFGRRVAAFAWELLDGGLVHMVASDAHNAVDRTFNLENAFAAISERYGEETAEILMFENPRRVLFGEPAIPGVRDF